MLCIAILLAGCGQLHPQIELSTVILENEDFKALKAFSISEKEFEEKLLATTSFKKIEVTDFEGDQIYIYQHKDKRIQLEIMSHEISHMLLIYFSIYEVRPLQDEKLTADVHDTLKKVVNILEENAYDKTIIQDLLAIQTLQELQVTGKMAQLTDTMSLASSISWDDEDQPYLVLVIEPLFKTEKRF